jgi:hypothetical protein
MCKHVLCNLMDPGHVQRIHHWRGHKVEFPRWHVHTRQVETNFSSGVTPSAKGKSNVLVFRKDISLSPENRQPHNHPYSKTVFVFSVKNLLPLRIKNKKTKLHGLSPRVNYTDRATEACRRSDCQLFTDRGCHVVSVTDPYCRIFGFLYRTRYFSIK